MGHACGAGAGSMGQWALRGGLRARAHGRPVPGPAYDLTFCEVRDSSLVLLWKAPVYAGGSPVSGYLVDYQEGDSGKWVTANEAATANRYLKVTPSPSTLVPWEQVFSPQGQTSRATGGEGASALCVCRMTARGSCRGGGCRLWLPRAGRGDLGTCASSHSPG